MKFKSLSTVKYLLVLFLAIASTSGYWGLQMQERNGALKESLGQLESDLQGARAALTSLETELSPDAAPVALDKAVASAMLAVYNYRAEFRVGIAQAKAGQSSGSLSAEVQQFAEAVPGTELKSVKVSLSGSYADYEGLLGYLAKLRSEHPLSIGYLRVSDLAFEMNIRVFGK